MFRILPETIKTTENYERKVREIKRRTFLKWKTVVKRRYLRHTCLHPNMSDFTAPTLINLLIEDLKSAQDTEYSDLTEIDKKYKAKATGHSVGNSLNFVFSNVTVEQGRAKHDWITRTKRYYGITWKSQSNSHIAIRWYFVSDPRWCVCSVKTYRHHYNRVFHWWHSKWQ